MRRLRGQKGVKKDQVEIGRTRHSIGMRVEGKEASVYRGSNVFLHVSFSRYMGGRFLMLCTGQAELACLRSESFRLQHSQSFLFLIRSRRPYTRATWTVCIILNYTSASRFEIPS